MLVGVLSKGMQIEVPETRVQNAYKAWLAYNFINVDQLNGKYEPHDGGGGFYEAVFGYSAALYCHGSIWRATMKRPANTSRASCP